MSPLLLMMSCILGIVLVVITSGFVGINGINKQTSLQVTQVTQLKSNVIFEDNFATGTRPDANKWTYELGYMRNNEKQFFTNNNSNIRDGYMIIESRRENTNGFNYTSASVTTRGKFQFTYGTLEIRAQIPATRGSWPAAWLLPVDGPWPDAGEIDLFENVGYEPDVVHASVHTANKNGANKNRDGATATTKISASDFNVYKLIWTEDKLEFQVNGTTYLTYKNERTGSRDWPFDKPFYLILNNSIGGDWGGLQGIDDASFPCQYIIDYVKVYK